MEDVRDLKELQIDALREVANIGAGHAATALSQLTNRKIMISVPQINIVRLEEVPDLLGNPQDVVAAVLMHMLGDLTGRTLLLFPESVGRRVCDMLLRRPVGTTAHDRAGPEDAGRAAQPLNRLSRHRLLRPARGAAAGAAALGARRPRRPLGAGTRLCDSRRARGGYGRVRAAARPQSEGR